MDYENIAKPTAPNGETERRWEHTAMRRRLVQGTYEKDLETEMMRHFSTDRYLAIGVPDLSSNILEQITRQLSVLYNAPPTVTNQEGDISALTGYDGFVNTAGFFQLMQRGQQLTLALRECFIRIDVVPHVRGEIVRKPGLQYRLVTPDYVYAESHPDAPDEPIYYQEMRMRMNPDTAKGEWVADVIDLRDESNPRFGMYRINMDGSLGDDVSMIYMGHATHEGASYPFRDKNNNPFMPVELYHAEKTGHLFDAYSGIQMAYGALTAATLMSFWVHCVRDCAFPLKYTLGATVAGLGVSDPEITARRATIATDPSSILMLNADMESGGQPMIGQFAAGAEPLKLLESISHYEKRVSMSAGLSSAILRESGDPRSGYALSVSRDGQREASAKFAISFSRHDARVLSKSAALANRFLGTNLPESGYRVTYAKLPKSPDEIEAIRKDTTEKLAAGLISPIQAMQMLHGTDLDEESAKQLLMKIRRERAEYM